MALTLVPKYVRALAEQLNAYYRVLRGTDADSIDLRLNGGGHFIVHHSGTNAPVFTVTDAGATGNYAPGDITNPDLADGAVTSAKIADDTIVNADINPAAAILVTKIAHVGANNVLRSTGGANVGGQVVSADIADDTIVNADINGAAAIALTKLQHVGAGNVLRSTGSANVGGPLVASDIPNSSITSAKIADNEIVNADINSAAAISITKIQDVGAGNVLRSDGAGNVAGKIVSGDIADGTIANVDVNAGAAIAPSKLAAVTAGQVLKDVGSGVVGGGLVVDANVAAAGTANIALGKLAPGAAGLLKSNGTAISAGNLLASADLPTGGAAIITSAMIVDGTIATADMTVNSINGDRIATGSLPGDRITGGAPPPSGAGVADAYKVYATLAAGTTVSLQQVVTEMLVANAVTRVHAANSLATAAVNSAGPNTLVDAPVASSGGYFLALVGGMVSNSVAGSITQLYIKTDAGGDVAVGGWAEPSANAYMPLLAIYPVGVIAAGAGHHVILRWGCTAGSTTTISSGFYTVLELIR